MVRPWDKQEKHDKYKWCVIVTVDKHDCIVVLLIDSFHLARI